MSEAELNELLTSLTIALPDTVDLVRDAIIAAWEDGYQAGIPRGWDLAEAHHMVGGKR